MKAVVTVSAILVTLTLTLAAPAHADVWDFSWVSRAMFGPGQGGEPAADRSASETTTATITAIPDGVRINFPTSVGAANVLVNGNEPAAGGDQAIGAVPMFFHRDGPLSIMAGSSLGVYSFSGGSFDNPDTFTVALSSGGSGPAGVERFVGTGTREVASTSEPAVMLLVGSALAGAARLRRRSV